MTSYVMEKYDQDEKMQIGLCTAVSDALEESIKRQGMASLVVSGGSTPKRLFQLLSEVELDWDKVTVSLADDRWVAPDHEDSNEMLVKENLLQNKANVARFIGLKNEFDEAKDGEHRCHHSLLEMPHPIDVLVLGMGNDGHTASLFPCSKDLRRAVVEDHLLCCGVIPETAPHQRMTLTLKTMLQSKNIFLQIAGESKYRVFQNALQEGAEDLMPIRYFLKGEKPLQVFWSR